jgi:flagellar basal-body rod protein FlgB
MSTVVGGLFNFSDKLQMESLTQRNRRSEVISANIANAETPGFRAFGYDFEKQLQDLGKMNEPIAVKVSDPRHLRNNFTKVDGSITPDVYVRPTESVDEDGNTVDMDTEMAQLAQNQILFRTAVETLNRKIGTLKYAINGGR